MVSVLHFSIELSYESLIKLNDRYIGLILENLLHKWLYDLFFN